MTKLFLAAAFALAALPASAEPGLGQMNNPDGWGARYSSGQQKPEGNGKNSNKHDKSNNSKTTTHVNGQGKDDTWSTNHKTSLVESQYNGYRGYRGW